MTEHGLEEGSGADSYRVDCSALRWRCDPDELGIESTEELEPLSGILGQDDAIEALRFGLETFAPGQNIYVRGLMGTGRMSLVRGLLDDIHPACTLAPDYCYVTNFDRGEEPHLLVLERGHAGGFRDAVEGLVRFLKKELGPALNSELLRERRRLIEGRFEAEAKKLSDPFESALAEDSLSMVSMRVGDNVRQAIVPLLDGKPAPPERVEELRAEGTISAKEIEALQEQLSGWGERLEVLTLEMRGIAQRRAEEIRRLYQGETRTLLEAEVAPIRESFQGEDVGRFLSSLLEHIVKHGVEELGSAAGARRFQVNVLAGHRPEEGCPVIVENSPTLANLLGTVDRTVLPDGAVLTDHLMITPGALLRADGGYLILEAREVMSEPGAWKVLLRTLRTGVLEIAPADGRSLWSTRTLKPQPIPLRVKVILIGDPGLYQALDNYDPEFPYLFKVLADFDSSVPRDSDSLRAYGGILARIARDEELAHFNAGAVAALAEHGARITGRNDRLTTRFGRLVDIAREAAFLCAQDGEQRVTGDMVRLAITRGKRRGDLPARKYRRYMAEGTIHVMTKGTCVGQVNGLAVIHAGSLNYGFPTRITATIGAGTAGMINIEREAQLSGAIHTKGFYILGGLLRHLLQTQHPMAFSASIAFEQSYGGIDGDSASGAEICCLISALTKIPLRQDLAMTGAIDQHGRILPIGAANEKIEGFFDTCRDLGELETQGVIIPKSNVGDLMLRQDVVDACSRGRFHVHAVETIQEALSLFTGYRVGERSAAGEYPKGTLLHLAVERTFELWALASASPVWEEDEEDEEDAEGKGKESGPELPADSPSARSR